MICEICGTTFRKIETFLICAQGHTLQNTIEVAQDDTNTLMVMKSKRVRSQKKQPKMFSKDDCRLMKMVLIKLLYEEAREFFNFPNDDIFKYFTGFFEFRKAKLETAIPINKVTFFTLLYISRRIQVEKGGKPYFFNDCKKDFRDLDIYTRLVLIKNKYESLEAACYEFSGTGIFLNLFKYREYFSDLTDSYIYPKAYGRTNDSENGVLEESIEFCKHNIIRLFRNDLDISKKYFKCLCKKYNLEESKSMDLYFEKFICTFNPYQVFIPEYDFVMFIAAYFINMNKFEGTPLELKVLTDLACSKLTFMKRIDKFCKYLDTCVSPEVFVEAVNEKNKLRFKRLKYAIEFIDGFKRSITKTLLPEKSYKRKIRRILKEEPEIKTQTSKVSPQ